MLVLSESYCYSEDSKPYNYFGPRTAYEHVHARNLSAPSSKKPSTSKLVHFTSMYLKKLSISVCYWHLVESGIL